MAMERVPMDKTRDILRLRWKQQLSVRDTAASVKVGTGTVSETTNRAKAAGLDWEAVEKLGDAELQEQLYRRTAKATSAVERPKPDPVHIHTQLKRPGVTLELLHLEYLEDHPNGYRYTWFCELYRSWQAQHRVWMRQSHKGGEKAFVDFSGQKPSYVDPNTGEVVEMELFIAALGASNLTYAVAVETQQVEDWIDAHNQAVKYFGGVTQAFVPDCLKSGVTRACRYEPTIQRTYLDWARHHGTAIVPARPRKPRDKPKVEVAVQIAQRWILARLRDETFFSPDTLNRRIAELCDEMNLRPMKKYGGKSRRDLYELLDRPHLKPLPEVPYVLTKWKTVTLNLDYHIEIEKHWYSAPYVLVHQKLEARITPNTVELYHRGERVAAHVRSFAEYQHTTDPAHMPEAHRRHSLGVDGVIAWGASVGPMTEAMVRRLIDANPFPEQGWRSARGLQRVGEKYGAERTERACAWALHFNARSYKPVARILELNREKLPLPGESAIPTASIMHENVRGPAYFH
jgi:transposase